MTRGHGLDLALGCHLSTSGGYAAMGRTAVAIGATTFAFFTRNPRGGSAKALGLDDVCDLRRILSENHFGRLVAHAPYTMNLCSANPDTMGRSREGPCERHRAHGEPALETTSTSTPAAMWVRASIRGHRPHLQGPQRRARTLARRPSCSSRPWQGRAARWAVVSRTLHASWTAPSMTSSSA